MDFHIAKRQRKPRRSGFFQYSLRWGAFSKLQGVSCVHLQGYGQNCGYIYLHKITAPKLLISCCCFLAKDSASLPPMQAWELTRIMKCFLRSESYTLNPPRWGSDSTRSQVNSADVPHMRQSSCHETKNYKKQDPLSHPLYFPKESPKQSQERHQ